MRYIGGKNRLGKEISEILKKYGPPNKVQGYLEPFCGSLGVTIHMVDDYHTTISDYNKSLIMLWKEIKSGKFKFPRHVSKTMWLKYKEDPRPSAMKAYVGHGYSFGGCWFSGYVAKYSNNPNRNLIEECKNITLKKVPYIKKINKIVHCSYDRWEPKGMLIYCDPPYQDTVQSYSSKKFDSRKFWDTMRKWSKYNVVIISEVNAPKDFKCIWKKKRINKANCKINCSVVEKLFIFR